MIISAKRYVVQSMVNLGFWDSYYKSFRGLAFAHTYSDESHAWAVAENITVGTGEICTVVPIIIPVSHES